MAELYLDQTTTVEVTNPAFRTVVQQGGLTELPAHLEEAGLVGSKAFIITDSNVAELYGETVSDALEGAGIETATLTIPAGETNKTLQHVANKIDELSAAKATRKDVVIALGGGVVGDLGGFVAAVYNRGVPLVQVPTTLLAMVDASVGGKTGVDHGGKNKTGSFYQPQLVLADPDVLRTLDGRTYTEGLGEIAKYAVLDKTFTPQLEASATDLAVFSEKHLDTLSQIIARCVKQKSDVIKADPHEKAPDGRILLNYGHTLAHGLEAAGNYKELLHGEAVSIGMHYVAQLAVRLGLANESFANQQLELLKSLKLPITYKGEASLDDILDNVAKDKKNDSSGTTRFVLPRAVGNMVVWHIDNATVRETIEDFLAA